MTNSIQTYLDAKNYEHKFCSNMWHDYFILDTNVLKGLKLFRFLFRFDNNKYHINTTTSIERFRIKFSHIIKVI